MTWEIFTLISVLSLSISVILQRVLLHNYKLDPYAYAVVFQLIVGCILLVFALPHGISLPGIEQLLLPALGASVFFGVGHIVYAKALQVVEASVFSVLFAAQAIWMMLFGVFLFQENLTYLQLAGSVLIFAGIGLIIKNVRSLKFTRGIVLGLLAGLLFGLAITCWSYVGRNTDELSWAAISFFTSTLVTLLIRPTILKNMGSVFKKSILVRLGVLGVFYGIGSVTMLYAYTLGTFSVVSPIRQMSIIVTVLLALVFLKGERTRIWQKVAAAVISFTGVALVVM